MPDLWDPNPDNIFNGPGKKPDPAPNGQQRPHQGGAAQRPPRPSPAHPPTS